MLNKHVLNEHRNEMISPKQLCPSPCFPFYFMTHFPAWGLEAPSRNGQGQEGMGDGFMGSDNDGHPGRVVFFEL